MSVNSQIDAIFAEWTTNDTPGMAVAVSKNGKVVHKDAYGMADLENGIRNKPDTVFFCASVAKQFTAMSVLLLAAMKKVRLDDAVSDHIPEMKHLPKITIRQLLHHTSGMRDMLIQLTLGGWRWGDDVMTRDDVLSLVSRTETLNFEPNERWAYSNTNYFLASEIVERVSGMSLGEFARQHIFVPLRMTSTRFIKTYGEIVENRAYGYRKVDQGYEKRMPNYNLTGPTNMVTTVEDLLRWDRNFDSHRVGGRATVAALQKPSPTSNGYGMGLFVVEDQDDVPRTIWHDGRTIGYHAHLIRYNYDRISVALLCNLQFTDMQATSRLVFAVARVVEGKPLPPMTNIEREQPPIDALATRPEELAAYCGTYSSSEADATFDVELSKDRSSLVIKRDKYPSCDLRRFADDTFMAQKFTAVLREVEFKFLKTGKHVTGCRLDWSHRVAGPRLMDFRFVKQK